MYIGPCVTLSPGDVGALGCGRKIKCHWLCLELGRCALHEALPVMGEGAKVMVNLATKGSKLFEETVLEVALTVDG